MGKYFVKRVLLLIPTILLVCIIVFALMRMIPMPQPRKRRDIMEGH